MKRLFFAILAGLSIPLALHARPPRVEEQLRVADTNELQLLIRMDGAMLIGRVTKIVADYVYFEVASDTSIIFISEIKELRKITEENIKNGRYWFPNPNANRLYLFPTARPLEKGAGYVAGYYVIAPMVAYGLTDNFSIAAGASFLAAVNVAGAYFLPKLGVMLGDYVALSIGGAAAQGLSQEDFDPTLIAAYGSATFGRASSSLTLGTGYGIFRLYTEGTQEQTSFNGTLGFMVGGEVRVARTISIVTENYFLQGLWNYSPVVSCGIRFFGERFSLEGAFINTLGPGGFTVRFPGFPFVGIIYNF